MANGNGQHVARFLFLLLFFFLGPLTEAKATFAVIFVKNMTNQTNHAFVFSHSQAVRVSGIHTWVLDGPGLEACPVNVVFSCAAPTS